VAVILFATAIVLVWADSMHPPAMGLALAFIIYRVGYTGVIVAVIGVIMLILLKKLIDWGERRALFRT
jgi:hypothetical protein